MNDKILILIYWKLIVISKYGTAILGNLVFKWDGLNIILYHNVAIKFIQTLY